MERKGISEALSVILILVVTTVIFSSVALYANQQLALSRDTASLTIENSKERVGELLSIIRATENLTHTKILVVNYGEKDIVVDRILADISQINATFHLYNGTQYCDTSNDTCSIKVNEIYNPTLIVIDSIGYDTIYIITSRDNLFEIDIS